MQTKPSQQNENENKESPNQDNKTFTIKAKAKTKKYKVGILEIRWAGEKAKKVSRYHPTKPKYE